MKYVNVNYLFSGRLCEEEKDDCIDQPCGLGATCIDEISKVYAIGDIVYTSFYKKL